MPRLGHPETFTLNHIFFYLDGQNDCDPSPCLNKGSCIDLDEGFHCLCVPGFYGETCEIGT